MKGSRTIMILGVACCLLALVATSSGEPIILDISREEIKNIHDEVEFHCTVQDAKESSVLWFKGLALISSNNILALPDPRYTITVKNTDSQTSSYILKIKDLKESDMGKYECRIQLATDKSVSRDVLLQMMRAPKIFKNITKEYHVVENGTIELKCDADGFPTPSITWKRADGVLFPNGQQLFKDNVLKIDKANKAHRGVYHCLAQNSVNNEQGVPKIDQANVTLQVEFAPMVTSVIPSVGQALGYSVKLHCKIDALPAPYVTWYGPSGKVVREVQLKSEIDSHVDTLHVSYIGLSDLGLYKCRAKNKFGSAETKFRIFEFSVPLP